MWRVKGCYLSWGSPLYTLWFSWNLCSACPGLHLLCRIYFLESRWLNIYPVNNNVFLLFLTCCECGFHFLVILILYRDKSEQCIEWHLSCILTLCQSSKRSCRKIRVLGVERIFIFDLMPDNIQMSCKVEWKLMKVLLCTLQRVQVFPDICSVGWHRVQICKYRRNLNTLQCPSTMGSLWSIWSVSLQGGLLPISLLIRIYRALVASPCFLIISNIAGFDAVPVVTITAKRPLYLLHLTKMNNLCTLRCGAILVFIFRLDRKGSGSLNHREFILLTFI